MQTEAGSGIREGLPNIQVRGWSVDSGGRLGLGQRPGWDSDLALLNLRPRLLLLHLDQVSNPSRPSFSGMRPKSIVPDNVLSEPEGFILPQMLYLEKSQRDYYPTSFHPLNPPIL